MSKTSFANANANTKEDDNIKKASKLLSDSIAEPSVEKREEILRMAYELNPTDGNIQFVLGKLLFEQNREEEASVFLDKAYNHSFLSIRVSEYLADYYYRNKQLQKSAIHLIRLINYKTGDNYLNNFRIAKISTEFKKYKQSNFYFRKAYELRKFSDNKEILLYIAKNYYALKEYKKVILFLKSYPYTNKNNKEALTLWIVSNYKLKNKKELYKSLKTYLTIWPKEKWAKDMLKKNSLVGQKTASSSREFEK